MKEIKKIINNIATINIHKMVSITILVIIVSFISVFIQNKGKENIRINDKKIEKEYGRIIVYISGAINSPGVFNLIENIRLEEALNLVGGVKQEADLSKLNLSKVLYDSEKIVIPYKQEETILLKEDINSSEEYDYVNINEASEVELMTLPGIGESTAKKIIEYRKSGDFESIEDIKKVPGIGNSKYEKIKDKISIE